MKSKTLSPVARAMAQGAGSSTTTDFKIIGNGKKKDPPAGDKGGAAADRGQSTLTQGRQSTELPTGRPR